MARSRLDDTVELPASMVPSPPDPGMPVEEPPSEARPRRLWIEFPILVISALLIAVFIKTFLFQAFWIPSSSMENTLEVYDRVLVNKLSYRFGEIDRGDVVVFDDPNGAPTEESVVASVFRNLRESVGLSTPKSEFIKRVVGIGGDTVEIRDGELLVNGEPEGSIFVMGDNRNASQDSRVFGSVSEDAVVGEAFVIIWPIDRWGGL
jgi:signal peptidase I